MDRIKIQGMSCQHCVKAVTEALRRVPGLKDVQVDLANGEAAFENTSNASPEEIRRAVEEAGFQIAR